MLLKDKLNITQEEQEYLINELFQRFKNMMNDGGLKKVTEQVEKMVNQYQIDNVIEFNIIYQQTFDIPNIEYLLNKYRNAKIDYNSTLEIEKDMNIENVVIKLNEFLKIRNINFIFTNDDKVDNIDDLLAQLNDLLEDNNIDIVFDHEDFDNYFIFYINERE